MAKTIAVWGAPGVGKTTLATKLAEVIHDRRHSTAVVLYADMDIPALPSLFPNYSKKELYSVGVPLSKADMTKEDVVKQIVTVRGKEKLGFLGFTDGENRYSYPRFDEDKVRELISILLRNAKYVILDCTSSLDNPISAYGVAHADEVIRLFSPTLKSICWQSSQLPLYADPAYRLDRQKNGLNTTEELFMPVEEAKAHIPDVKFCIPYSRTVRQQMLDGQLWNDTKDLRFEKEIQRAAGTVI